MPDNPGYACLIVDDYPINTSYWSRQQQIAFGYRAKDTGLFGYNWPAQAAAPFFPVALAHELADFFDEFGVRDKFTCVPYPAGLGRIDRDVRGYTRDELVDIGAIVGDRIAQRFDIRPEVLTHTMALDPKTEALLPHGETPWLAYLCTEKRGDDLQAYLCAAFQVFANVGIAARGITIGGMPDPSGIARGESLGGQLRGELSEALLAVEHEFDPAASISHIFSGGPPLSAASQERHVPEIIHTADDASKVFEIHSHFGDPILNVFYGKGDPQAEADRLVSPDLEGGEWTERIEKGIVLTITVHAQTLNSLNTGLGFQILREAVRRLGQR